MTTAAFGAIDSFRRQLSVSLDDWGTTLDSALARDSNGHHGIAVADVDGDGLEDVYVCQPHGFPNRLYRARGDGTFEDVTERSGLGILEDTQHALFADVDNDGDQDLVLLPSSGPILFRNDGTGHFTRDPDAFRFARPLQGAAMGMAIGDYDRDGFLDLYLCVYSYTYGAGDKKAGTPTPYYDATNGPPNVLFRNDGHGRFVEVTDEVGLDAGNDRFSFSAAWGDYDGDGWPDLVVTNDFGRKNLYHNLGLRDGKVRFEDVSAKAGIEDYAAGMSVFWFDFDGDGRPDIYGGQMWSDNGLRVTASPDFMRDAPERVRALYHHHARGNSLFRNRGDGTFEDVSVAARAEMGRWTWSSGALDFDSDGWEDVYLRERHGHPRGERPRPRRAVLGRRRGTLAAHPGRRHPVRRRLAWAQLADGRPLGRRAPAPRVPAQRRPAAASTTSPVPWASTSTRTAGPSPSSTSTVTATRTSSTSPPARRPSCACFATTSRLAARRWRCASSAPRTGRSSPRRAASRAAATRSARASPWRPTGCAGRRW